MNVWTFSGRVGADAELRTTQSGEKVLNFRVANDIGFGDRKTTQWVDCQYWGKRAEAVSSYVQKGDKITVSGEVQLVEFQRRDGTPGSKLAVRVNDLDLAARNESAGQRSGGDPEYDQSINSRPSGGGGKPAFDMDSEIPF